MTTTATDNVQSSATRMLSVLDLFTLDKPIWTPEALLERLELSQATAYRYLKYLQSAGFLTAAPGGGYMLGPRFIEFERTIRLTSPLLQVLPPIIKEIRDIVGGAIVVSGFYGDRVLAVLQDRLDMNLPLQMDRGRPFPLFFGAPSRIIVAYLPTYRLRNLLLHHPQEIAAAGLGETWPEFKKKLKEIRRAGYYMSSQLHPDLVGIAAPIFRAPSEVTASICLVRAKNKVTEDDIAMLIELSVSTAARITKDLQCYVPRQEPEIPFKIRP